MYTSPGLYFGNPPSWVLKGAAVDMDFANSRYWGGSIDSLLSTVRASDKYVRQSSGLYLNIGSGFPGISDLGLLIEQAATNNALYARDWTQAGSWTATDVTTALNAVGIEGQVNSATTLTATGANGTVLQAITLASAAYTFSVFIKRVSGSGNIDITIDGGSTWNTVAGLSSTAFTRYSFEATQLNPSIGVRIVTSGDVVIVDFAQLEVQIGTAVGTSGFASSPIYSTNSAATRAADSIAYVGRLRTLWNNPATGCGSAFADTSGVPSGQVSSYIVEVQATNHILMDGTTTTTVRAVANNVALTATLGSGTLTSRIKRMCAWDSSGKSVVGNAGAIATGTAAFTSTTSTPLIGATGSSLVATGNWYNGFIARLAAWNYRVEDNVLQRMTGLT